MYVVIIQIFLHDDSDDNNDEHIFPNEIELFVDKIQASLNIHFSQFINI